MVISNFKTENYRVFCEMLFVLAAAIVFRFLAWQSLGEVGYLSYLSPDEVIYFEWAQKIASGEFVSDRAYLFSPLPAYLYSLLFAFAEGITSDSARLCLRLLNCLLGLASVALVYFLGGRVGRSQHPDLLGQRLSPGLLSGLLAAGYMPLVFYNISLLKTSLAVFLFLLFLFFSIQTFSSKERKNICVLAMGLSLAMLSLVRENALVLLPVVLLMLVFVKGKREVFLFSLVFLAILSPVLIRNFEKAGALVVTENQAAINFFLGNTNLPGSGYYRPVIFASSAPISQLAEFSWLASSLKEEEESESSYWFKRTLSENGLGLFARIARKFFLVFNRFEAGEQYSVSFLYSQGLLFGIGFSLILGLSLVGIRRVDKSYLILIAVYGLGLLPFFISSRYRLPFAAALLPIAGIGLSSILNPSSWSGPGRFKLFKRGLFALSVIGFAMIPWPETKDVSNYLNRSARVALVNNNFDLAVLTYEESCLAGGYYSDFGCVELARLSYQKGERVRAHSLLNGVLETSPARAPALNLLANFLQKEKKIARATIALEQSLKVRPGQFETRIVLGRIYALTRPGRAKELSDELYKLRDLL